MKDHHLQSLFSSILWNFFMINYHRVLETDQYWGDVNYEGVVEAQGSILRSSSMWMVSQLSSELSRFVFSGLLFLATSQSSVDNTGILDLYLKKKIDFELVFGTI